MTKLDHVKALQKAGFTRVNAEKAVDVLFTHMRSALMNGEEVQLHRIGKLHVKMHKARDIKSAVTEGKVVHIPRRRAIKFTTYKSTKIDLNQ